MLIKFLLNIGLGYGIDFFLFGKCDDFDLF